MTCFFCTRIDIAVDWITDKIYWSSRYQQTINVLDIHSRHHKVLLNTTNPPKNDILVDPITRYAIIVVQAIKTYLGCQRDSAV